MVNTFNNVSQFEIMSFMYELEGNDLKDRVTACIHKGTTLEVHTSGADLNATELAELTSLVVNHDVNSYSVPRIIRLARYEAKEKHFHNIDYKKELENKLQMTVTFSEPGLMTQADLFEDEAKTIPVLSVKREYNIDATSGKIVAKKTTREYYNENGTINNYIKDTGWYNYTDEESRAATHRRRVNITNKLEADLLAMLVAGAQGNAEAEAANIAGGAMFMKALTPAVSVFHLSGDISDIVSYVSNTVNQTTYPFLLADVAPGVKAYQFIIAGVTY